MVDNEDKLQEKAIKCVESFRAKWNLAPNKIDNFRSLVESKGFLLLCFPNYCGISGIFLKKRDREVTYQCIYINSMEPLGRQNFSLAHEIYHAYFEESHDGICFNSKFNIDPIEKTAEKFASNLLIPRKILIEQIHKKNKDYFSFSDIVDLQNFFQVSFQAVVYAINELKKQDKNLRPMNIKNFNKYFKGGWNELSRKTLAIDSNNFLNTPTKEFYFPESFKKNLLNNYKKGKIKEQEMKEIFYFFDEKIEE